MLIIKLTITSSASLGLYQSCRILCKHLHKKTEIERFDVDTRFTNAIKYGDLVFISGQVGTGSTIKEQAEAALRDVDAALSQAGTDKTKILECTVWLSNMKADYAAFNEVYDSWIPKGLPPTRACVQAELYSPDCKVEVRVVAAAS